MMKFRERLKPWQLQKYPKDRKESKKPSNKDKMATTPGQQKKSKMTLIVDASPENFSVEQNFSFECDRNADAMVNR